MEQDETIDIKVSYKEGDLAALKMQAAPGRPYALRLSSGFALRMHLHLRSEVPYILHAIDHLEGLHVATNLKRCEPFRRPQLKGLWHQHYFAPRHMMRNIFERWGMEEGGNFELTKMINAAVRSEIDADGDIEHLAGVLGSRIADGYVDRSREKRITGDWIVFAIHEGEKYYLDLATHEEGLAGEPAERLLSKLRKSAELDFPFVFDSLGGAHG